MARYLGARKVQTCMRVVLCQTKNGLPSLLALSMKGLGGASRTPPKGVIPFLALGRPGCMWGALDMSGYGASGPSSTIRCFPTLPQRGITVWSSLSVAQVWTRFRGPYFAWKAGSLGKEYQYGSDIASR